MKAYSIDLRERVAAAATGQFPIAQVARQFTVCICFVDKVCQRIRGSVAALPRRGGPAPRRDEAARQLRSTGVAAQPDAMLDEGRQHLGEAGGPAVGRTLLWQTRQQLKWRRKKRGCLPPSATPSGGGAGAKTFSRPLSTKLGL